MSARTSSTDSSSVTNSRVAGSPSTWTIRRAAARYSSTARSATRRLLVGFPPARVNPPGGPDARRKADDRRERLAVANRGYRQEAEHDNADAAPVRAQREPLASTVHPPTIRPAQPTVGYVTLNN